MKGPNQVWSVDGYMKLESFGIEIYGGIDAYSRYITWFYVGTSARTEVSVYRQYVDIVGDTTIMPAIIRSDRGSETPLMTQAHFELRCREYQLRTNHLSVEERQNIFKKCYYYGTSTSNQRIEAWWGQLSKGQIYRWRISF